MNTPARNTVARDSRAGRVGRVSRVVRAFAFVDLCRFTDFVDAQGDEAAVAELGRLRTTVREVAATFGVRVDKWLGDGVMLVAVEVEPLVAAVVTIEERFRQHGRLALRAGIAAGPVILLEGDDYVGQAVNLASRLCDHAGAGRILAAADGLLLPEGVEVAERVDVTIRGMAGSVGVLVITAAGAQHQGVAAAALSVVDGLRWPVRQLRAGRSDQSA
jgi:class 3 adenylate cyclase